MQDCPSVRLYMMHSNSNNNNNNNTIYQSCVLWAELRHTPFNARAREWSRSRRKSVLCLRG